MFWFKTLTNLLSQRKGKKKITNYQKRWVVALRRPPLVTGHQPELEVLPLPLQFHTGTSAGNHPELLWHPWDPAVACGYGHTLTLRSWASTHTPGTMFERGG